MSADAVARWVAHLDAVESAVSAGGRADAPAPMPSGDGLPPLPAELAARAQRTLSAVQAAAGELAARRDAVAAELAELGAPRPRPAASGPVYLDTTG